MNSTLLQLAGFFDGPWMFFVIVLAGAFINWLTKRRQEEAERNATRPLARPPNPLPSQPTRPSAEWEERMRRMLGEEVGAPPLIPPIVREAAPRRQPPVITAAREGKLVRPPVRLPVPPPPTEIAPLLEEEAEIPSVEETVRRFEKMDPAVMTPVRPLGQLRQTEGSRLGAVLRRREVARQAFLTSLVFGPPKALEE